MSKIAAMLTLSLGLGILVGGCFAFAVGLLNSTPIDVRGLGPFDRLWNPADYCFLGTILAGAGSALFAFGLGWFLLLWRHGHGMAPRGSTAVWALTLAVGLTGLGVAVGLWRATQQPPALTGAAITQEEANRIGQVLAAYSSSGNDKLLTEHFARRLRGQKEVITYHGNFNFRAVAFGADGAICTGHALAAGQVTHSDAGGAVMVKNVQFPEPRRMEFSMRVLRNAEGQWRIDDLQFAD